MISNRRTQPIPQDFIAALSHHGVTPGELLQHVKLPLLPSITQPSLPSAPADEVTPPQIDGILGPSLAGLAIRKKYVPAHLPELPSRHTWQDTPIYTKREKDARKIRELATEEGVLAERAMRKVMAGASFSKPQARGIRSEKDQMMWEQALDAVMQMDEEQSRNEEQNEWEGLRGIIENGEPQTAASFDAAIPVNYERRFWRSAAKDG